MRSQEKLREASENVTDKVGTEQGSGTGDEGLLIWPDLGPYCPIPLRGLANANRH
jgi:hypothetical protein